MEEEMLPVAHSEAQTERPLIDSKRVTHLLREYSRLKSLTNEKADTVEASRALGKVSGELMTVRILLDMLGQKERMRAIDNAGNVVPQEVFAVAESDIKQFAETDITKLLNIYKIMVRATILDSILSDSQKKYTRLGATPIINKFIGGDWRGKGRVFAEGEHAASSKRLADILMGTDQVTMAAFSLIHAGINKEFSQTHGVLSQVRQMETAQVAYQQLKLSQTIQAVNVQGFISPQK